LHGGVININVSHMPVATDLSHTVCIVMHGRFEIFKTFTSD